MKPTTQLFFALVLFALALTGTGIRLWSWTAARDNTPVRKTTPVRHSRPNRDGYYHADVSRYLAPWWNA